MATTHYTITTKQLIILKLLYRFRFTTSDLLTKATGIQKSTINKRLHLLLELGYVGRKYETEYRLQRKHASYNLLPEGIKALKSLQNPKYRPIVLRNISNDKTASDQFIDHNLGVFNLFCTLKARYGDDLQFFTKSQITKPGHFPKPLPDAYVQVGKGSARQHFFIDILHEGQPSFLSTRRVMYYIDYARKANWSITHTKLPKILLVCDEPALEKRLTKRMSRAIADIETKELKLSTIVLGEIGSGRAWHNMAKPD